MATEVLCTLVIDERERTAALAEEARVYVPTHKGGSGHLTVRLGDRTSQLPLHGSRKELGSKLVAKNKKDLGLDDA